MRSVDRGVLPPPILKGPHGVAAALSQASEFRSNILGNHLIVRVTPLAYG